MWGDEVMGFVGRGRQAERREKQADKWPGVGQPWLSAAVEIWLLADSCPRRVRQAGVASPVPRLSTLVGAWGVR